MEKTILWRQSLRKNEDLQADIAERLARRIGNAAVASSILNCEDGLCTRCGDLCPVRAAKWLRDNFSPMRKLFLASQNRSIRQFYFSRTTWNRAVDELADVGIEAILKSLRRALDSLREPSVVAVGLVDAFWRDGRWHIGAHATVGSCSDLDLYRAFDHTKSIQGPLEILPVLRIKRTLRQLFRRDLPGEGPARHSDEFPKASLRGEYYAWLAGLAPNDRLFRYGCDRYFNQLEKEPLPIRHKAKKGHPYPYWLEPWQRRDHPQNCSCRFCCGGGQ